MHRSKEEEDNTNRNVLNHPPVNREIYKLTLSFDRDKMEKDDKSMVDVLSLLNNIGDVYHTGFNYVSAITNNNIVNVIANFESLKWEDEKKASQFFEEYVKYRRNEMEKTK